MSVSEPVEITIRATLRNAEARLNAAMVIAGSNGPLVELLTDALGDVRSLLRVRDWSSEIDGSQVSLPDELS